MTNVYIEQENIPDLPFSLVFWPNYKSPIKESRLFLRDIMKQYLEPFFTIAATPEAADFFAVPFEFFDVQERHNSYLEKVYAVALALKKKVLLFDYTDYVDRVPKLPSHAILFRVSAYRHHKQRQEIVMPYFVEDLGSRYTILPKEIQGEPSIGYCGYSQFKNSARKWRAYGTHVVQWLILRFRFDHNPSVHTRGIFWRQRAMRLLQISGVSCRFIVRPFYSGHRMSVTLDAGDIRREYVENLRECDIALCVRGDANASQRFYEVLSASRIPLFLDTDCVLPLEETIEYDRIILRVSSREFQTLPSRVRVWQKNTSSANVFRIEREAREVYDRYLRLDRFFSMVFDRTQSPYKHVLFS